SRGPDDRGCGRKLESEAGTMIAVALFLILAGAGTAEDETVPQHRERGLAAMRQGRAAEAVSHFEAAIRLDSADAVSQDGLGVLLAQQGDVGAATRHFRAAVEARPDFAEARFHLALALDRSGLADEAIPQYYR